MPLVPSNAYPTPLIETLAGPLMQPAVTQYDSDFWHYMNKTDQNFPTIATHGDNQAWFLYDYAAVMYKAYFRTGEVRFRNRARQHVDDLRANTPWFDAKRVAAKTTGDYNNYSAVQSYHSGQAYGFAIYALEMAASGTPDPFPDNRADVVCTAYARHCYSKLAKDGDEGWWGPRDAAFLMDWILASIATGHGHEPMVTEFGTLPNYISAASIVLERILAAQGHYGPYAVPGLWGEEGVNFAYPDNPWGTPGGNCQQFMTGLLGHSLTMYNRLLGVEPRIVPALVAAYNALEAYWNQEVTCGHPESPDGAYPAWGCYAKAYDYGTRAWIIGVPSPPSPIPRLNGLFMALLGYLGQQTGDARYTARIHDCWDGVHLDCARGDLTTKEIAENFRGSGNAYGYLTADPEDPGTTPPPPLGTITLTAASTVQAGVGLVTPLRATCSEAQYIACRFRITGGPVPPEDLQPEIVGTGSAPQSFLFNWSLNPAWTPIGVYTLTATARRSNGQTLTSAPHTLTVTAGPPPVDQPVLTVSPTSLVIDGTVGEDPIAPTVQVTNTGPGTMAWSLAEAIPWLEPNPINGSAPSTVTFTVHPAGLPAGTHTGTITWTAEGATGSPAEMAVTLTLVAAPVDPPPVGAVLAVFPLSFEFVAVPGGELPADQPISITNTGTPGPLPWTATVTCSKARRPIPSHIAVTPSTATAPVPAVVGIDPSTEYNPTANGPEEGTMTITAPGAQGSPRAIPYRIVVAPQPPILITEPTEGVVVVGSVPLAAIVTLP